MRTRMRVRRRRAAGRLAARRPRERRRKTMGRTLQTSRAVESRRLARSLPYARRLGRRRG